MLALEDEKAKYVEQMAKDIDDLIYDAENAFREIDKAQRAVMSAQSTYNYLFESVQEKRKLYRIITGEEYPYNVSQ